MHARRWVLTKYGAYPVGPPMSPHQEDGLEQKPIYTAVPHRIVHNVNIRSWAKTDETWLHRALADCRWPVVRATTNEDLAMASWRIVHFVQSWLVVAKGEMWWAWKDSTTVKRKRKNKHADRNGRRMRTNSTVLSFFSILFGSSRRRRRQIVKRPNPVHCVWWAAVHYCPSSSPSYAS